MLEVQWSPQLICEWQIAASILFHPYNYFQKQWKLLLERLQSTGRGSESKWCGHFQHTLFTSDSQAPQARENRWFALFGMSYVTSSQLTGSLSVSPCIPVVCVLTPVVSLAKKPALIIARILCDTALIFSGSLLVYMSDCKYFYIVGKKVNP